jgi:hypothetical protein
LHVLNANSNLILVFDPEVPLTVAELNDLLANRDLPVKLKRTRGRFALVKWECDNKRYSYSMTFRRFNDGHVVTVEGACKDVEKV